HEEHDLVVRRLRAIGGLDRLAAAERSDRDPLEDELDVVRELLEHARPVARADAFVETVHVFVEQRHVRASRLYFTRWGSSASAPRVSLTQAAYSCHEPSNHVTCESPSKARMCVAIRSRNQRSCEMTTAQPAKSSSASSSARRVSTSRSFVGSSRSRTLPPERRSLARWTRFRSPPLRSETRFCWSEPLK